MNTLPYELIKIILRHCINDILAARLVCTKWAKCLQPGGEILTADYIKNHESPASLPAACYIYFTRLQKIKLNCYSVDTFTTLSTINEKYLTDWVDIKKYMIDDPRRIREIFSLDHQKTLLLLRCNEQYFKYLFKHYEQYRHYILSHISQEKIRSIILENGGWNPVWPHENTDKIIDKIWTCVDAIFVDIVFERADLYWQYLKTVECAG